MGINEDLRSFINKYKVEKGKPYTNTSIGYPKISIYVPNENYEDLKEQKVPKVVPLPLPQKKESPQEQMDWLKINIEDI